jgi:hypothetical protein
MHVIRSFATERPGLSRSLFQVSLQIDEDNIGLSLNLVPTNHWLF